MGQKITIPFLLIWIFSIASIQAQQKMISGKILTNDHPYKAFSYKENTNRTTTCNVDTVSYPLAKSLILPSIFIGTSSALAGGQYYDAPQAITVHGFTFYAYKENGLGSISQNVTCAIYYAGPDSLPIGGPLATATVAVDTVFGGGQLSAIRKIAFFASPVTVNAPYILVMENNSVNNIALVCNNYVGATPDGKGEWLGMGKLGSNWVHGYDISISGNTFDADFLMHPNVSYDLSANFSFNPTCLAAAGTVNFINASSPVNFHRMYSQTAFVQVTAISFDWHFGDGSPSVSAVDTSHAYASGGPFTVSLVDTMFGWTGICRDSMTIDIPAASPTSAFSFVANGIQVDFTDGSTDALSWSWDFGDGNISASANPTHVYGASGTYTACLIASNSCGADTSCQSVMVICAAPVASFSDSSYVLDAHFTSTSSGATNFAWTFGDGNTSTNQNPMHTYSLAGDYQVCLAVANACGNDTICDSIMVSCPIPDAGFTYATSNLDVSFNNTTITTGNSTFIWNFGDGNTSNDQNAAHSYLIDGSYTVCLIVNDSCGSDTSCLNVTINCQTPSTAFSWTGTNGNLNFSNNTTGTGISSWAWDFGDGNTSSSQSPNYSYDSTGVYEVCLVATNVCGFDSACHSVAVAVALEESIWAKNVSIYPNPSHSTFQIQVDLKEGKEIMIDVFNVLGNKISSQNLGVQKSALHALDLSSRSNGIYFISIRAGHQRLVRKVQLIH